MKAIRRKSICQPLYFILGPFWTLSRIADKFGQVCSIAWIRQDFKYKNREAAQQRFGMQFKPGSFAAALPTIPSLSPRFTDLFPTSFWCVQRAGFGLLVEPVWIDPAVQSNKLGHVVGCWLAGIVHEILIDKSWIFWRTWYTWKQDAPGQAVWWQCSAGTPWESLSSCINQPQLQLPDVSFFSVQEWDYCHPRWSHSVSIGFKVSPWMPGNMPCTVSDESYRQCFLQVGKLWHWVSGYVVFSSILV